MWINEDIFFYSICNITIVIHLNSKLTGILPVATYIRIRGIIEDIPASAGIHYSEIKHKLIIKILIRSFRYNELSLYLSIVFHHITPLRKLHYIANDLRVSNRTQDQYSLRHSSHISVSSARLYTFPAHSGQNATHWDCTSLPRTSEPSLGR